MCRVILLKPPVDMRGPAHCLRDVGDHSMSIPCRWWWRSPSLMAFYHNFFPLLMSCRETSFCTLVQARAPSQISYLPNRILNPFHSPCPNHTFSRCFSNIRLGFLVSSPFDWLASYSTSVTSMGIQRPKGPGFIERVLAGCWQRRWVPGWPH